MGRGGVKIPNFFGHHQWKPPYPPAQGKSETPRLPRKMTNNSTMYARGKTVEMEQSVGIMPKNLQVVSFDAEWNEIYVGTARRDVFSASCPNPVPKASRVAIQLHKFPLENPLEKPLESPIL